MFLFFNLFHFLEHLIFQKASLFPFWTIFQFVLISCYVHISLPNYYYYFFQYNAFFLFYNNSKMYRKYVAQFDGKKHMLGRKKLINKINMNSKENIFQLKRSWISSKFWTHVSQNRKLKKVFVVSPNKTTSIYKSYHDTGNRKLKKKLCRFV